jgi:hypothetical protein
MRQLHIRPVLFYSLALLLTASLLAACGQENVVPRPDKIVTASGLVLDMPLGTPLADATVQLISNEFFIDDPDFERTCDCEGDLCNVWTTSDAEGRWEMDVPVKYNESLAPLNMLMKVSKGTTPPQYNLFQPGGTNQGDLQLLNSGFYLLFALTSGSSLLDLILGQSAVFLGVAIGFAEVGYPGEIAMLPGVTVTAEAGDPAEELPMVYLGESGLPDPNLTETSALGVYYFSVPNANDDVAPSVELKGDKPGSVFVGGYYPACPGSSTGVAVIDPYYRP